MNLVKKLAVGLATASVAMGALITPVFAGNAYNNYVDNHSHATAVSVDVSFKRVRVTNAFTYTESNNFVRANSGGNRQMFIGGDDNTMTSGAANASGNSTNSTNNTNINL